MIAIRLLLTAVIATALNLESAMAMTLHDAVRTGKLAQVEGLLRSGAAIDARNSSDETPLLIAVQHDQTAIAKALIAAGADINAQAANQDSPWLLAGASGRTEIVRAMIPKGPDFRSAIAMAATRSLRPVNAAMWKPLNSSFQLKSMSITSTASAGPAFLRS
jgi:ankyrin repeat protein